MAEREIFWNINNQSVYLITAALSLLCFVLGFLYRMRFWHQTPQLSLKQKKPFFSSFMRIFVTKDVIKGHVPKYMHLMIYGGFLVLAAGSAFIALDKHFSLDLFSGYLYQVLSLIFDLAGFIVLAGILTALYMRLIIKPDRLEHTAEDFLLLFLLFFIILTGFCVESLRMLSAGDAHGFWSPVGWLLAEFFSRTGVSQPEALQLHQKLWYIHMFASFGFIALIPFTKLRHLVTAPIHLLLTRVFTPLPSSNPEETVKGIGNLKDFTWPQLLESDACASCGRCQKNCPVYCTKGTLSPKNFSANMRKEIGSSASSTPQWPSKLILPDTLWSCLSCKDCEDHCPVSIKYIDKFVGLKRHLVAQGNMPSDIRNLFDQIKDTGNAWGTAAETSQSEPVSKNGNILYWVGCTGKTNPKSIKAVQSTLNILNKAGVSYQILGAEESCCGSFCYALGNERLFRELVEKNRFLIKKTGVDTIVTHCPHCYNTLKNDYFPDEKEMKVFHHTTFLYHLYRNGQIQLQDTPAGIAVYKDPCYLGRHNGIYEEPRALLKAMKGLQLTEMKKNRNKSICCGGGDGSAFKSTTNHQLLKKQWDQIKKTEADWIVTSCPHCSFLIQKGTEKKEVVDIAELLEKNLL